jgi:sulfatase modifying factor 1
VATATGLPLLYVWLLLIQKVSQSIEQQQVIDTKVSGEALLYHRYLPRVCGGRRIQFSLMTLLMLVRCGTEVSDLLMRAHTAFLVVAALLAAFSFTSRISAQIITATDAFGSGANTFTIDFVDIGNAGNAADTTEFGAVPYDYRIGKFEISQNQIDRATVNGMANVTAGAWLANQPAANISWVQAAAFVNWLNTSTGKQAAYNLTFSGSWSMTLWSSADAWQLGGENLYRHKDAYYFMPSDNEWYKAAYFNPAGSNYFNFPTGSDTFPTPVTSGTNADTAVFNLPSMIAAPAMVDSAGGLSPYGTMGQGGNVFEWNETARDGTNDSPNQFRRFVGGAFNEVGAGMVAGTFGVNGDPSSFTNSALGFRVASVPEPSTYALLAMSAAGALWWARRKR